MSPPQRPENNISSFRPPHGFRYAAVGLPVNVHGLAFSNITVTNETEAGVPLLVIEGTIVGLKERAMEVPRLRLALRDRNREEIYDWTALPSGSVLAPRETLTFRSRLPSPPAEGDVLVRFFHPRDRFAGI